jgi:hypothetical protein
MGANIPGFIGVVHSVIDDIPVNNDQGTWLLHQSREFASSIFEDAHRDRVCMQAFIGVSVCAL